jgi:Ser/Thr protein kinase RdoA (MazF antagonist)
MKDQRVLNVHDAWQVEQFLSRPEIEGALSRWTTGTRRVELLSDDSDKGVIYRVRSDQGGCVLRFPLDERQTAGLRQEARIAQGICPLVRIDISGTRFFPAKDGRPVHAIHQWIDGEPLTTEMYVQMAEGSKRKLAHDLAEFLVALHSVDLAEAATWYADGSLAHLPPGYGKPQWFDGRLRARVPEVLNPHLEPDLILAVAETVRGFEALVVAESELALCHGDIHGFNVAMRATPRGYELGGIFDFEIAGVLDVHEDFFRLHFISPGLVERVVDAYEEKQERITLDRARIDLYWRAFLIYLMVEHLEVDDLDRFRLYENFFVETVERKAG